MFRKTSSIPDKAQQQAQQRAECRRARVADSQEHLRTANCKVQPNQHRPPTHTHTDRVKSPMTLGARASLAKAPASSAAMPSTRRSWYRACIRSMTSRRGAARKPQRSAGVRGHVCVGGWVGRRHQLVYVPLPPHPPSSQASYALTHHVSCQDHPLLHLLQPCHVIGAGRPNRTLNPAHIHTRTHTHPAGDRGRSEATSMAAASTAAARHGGGTSRYFHLDVN